MQFTFKQAPDDKFRVNCRVKERSYTEYQEEPFVFNFCGWQNLSGGGDVPTVNHPTASLHVPGIPLTEITPLVDALQEYMTAEARQWWDEQLRADTTRRANSCNTCAKLIGIERLHRPPSKKKLHLFTEQQLQDKIYARKAAEENLRQHLATAGPGHRRCMPDFWFPQHEPVGDEDASSASEQEAKQPSFAPRFVVRPAPMPLVYNGPDPNPADYQGELQVGDFIITIGPETYPADWPEDQKRVLDISKVEKITETGYNVRWWGAASNYKRIANSKIGELHEKVTNKPWRGEVLHGCTILLYGFKLTKNKKLEARTVTKLHNAIANITDAAVKTRLQQDNTWFN